MCESATDLAELDVLLHFPADVRAIMADVGLCSVLQVSQFDFKEAYLAFYRSHPVDSEEDASIKWFPYVRSCSVVLDIPARKIIIGKRTASDVQVKK